MRKLKMTFAEGVNMALEPQPDSRSVRKITAGAFQGRVETELVNQVCESVYVCLMIFAAGGHIWVNDTIFFFL